MDKQDLLPPLRDCRRCPRLVDWRNTLRRDNPELIDRPVGSWGAKRPAILLVGLAPGPNGAARSGKAFVGDASGSFLFAALHECGLATSADPARARLLDTRLTNAVKCLPPANTPSAQEQNNCAAYLTRELDAYCPRGGRRPRVVVSLGGLAHRRVCATLGLAGKPYSRFAHGAEYKIGRKLTLMACFHPSRLNVNTGRITPSMLRAVLWRCRQLVAPTSA